MNIILQVESKSNDKLWASNIAEVLGAEIQSQYPNIQIEQPRSTPDSNHANLEFLPLLKMIVEHIPQIVSTTSALIKIFSAIKYVYKSYKNDIDSKGGAIKIDIDRNGNKYHLEISNFTQFQEDFSSIETLIKPNTN